jgi:hypothetical protein
MSLIKKKDEIPVSKNLFMLIYGEPASFKTSTALSAEKPLLFDLEFGCQRINREWQTDTVQPETYSQMLEVLEKEDLSGYKSLVFHTLLALNDLCMEEILTEMPSLRQKDNSPSLKAYGVAKVRFKALVDMLSKMNKTIIFISHSSEARDGEDLIIRIDGSTSAVKEITKKLDAMAFISVHGQKHTLNFRPTGKYYAKPIQGVPDYIDIPILEQGQPNTFLQDMVINPAIAYRSQGVKKKDSYATVLKTAKDLITKNGVNEEVKAKLRALEVVGDSRQQIAEMIKEWESKNAKVLPNSKSN